MSQAETLLNELEEVAEEARIVIGSDRRIKVPDSLKRIAVQYDHNIETVTFECPRYWDGNDMSKMDISINYLRADNKPGSFKVENVTTEEGSLVMTFNWVIKRHLTQISGVITFAICISGKDEDGKETMHWNSMICSDMSVSKGLEVNEVIVEEYPDEIAVLTDVTEADNGKFMRVVDGAWAAVAMPYAEEASF